jgi:hypothetical protein
MADFAGLRSKLVELRTRALTILAERSPEIITDIALVALVSCRTIWMRLDQGPSWRHHGLAAARQSEPLF